MQHTPILFESKITEKMFTVQWTCSSVVDMLKQLELS